MGNVNECQSELCGVDDKQPPEIDDQSPRNHPATDLKLSQLRKKALERGVPDEDIEAKEQELDQMNATTAARKMALLELISSAPLPEPKEIIPIESSVAKIVLAKAVAKKVRVLNRAAVIQSQHLPRTPEEVRQSKTFRTDYFACTCQLSICVCVSVCECVCECV